MHSAAQNFFLVYHSGNWLQCKHRHQNRRSGGRENRSSPLTQVGNDNSNIPPQVVNYLPRSSPTIFAIKGLLDADPQVLLCYLTFTHFIIQIFLARSARK